MRRATESGKHLLGVNNHSLSPHSGRMTIRYWKFVKPTYDHLFNVLREADEFHVSSVSIERRCGEKPVALRKKIVVEVCFNVV